MMKMVLAAVVVVGAIAAPAQASNLADGLGFAAGYKLGNGMGLMGVDLVVRPAERWSLDVQLARSIAGLDMAPAVQYRLDDAGTYVALGYQRTTYEVYGQPLGRNGMFANVGRQWTPWPWLNVIAGVGYQYGFGARETVFGQPVDTLGLGGLNVELGARYLFQ